MTVVAERQIAASVNPLGLVASAKRCAVCPALIWWNHKPGAPAEYEPSQAACRDCDPGGWNIPARLR